MKKSIHLIDDSGSGVVAILDNWGSARDERFRRWVREPDGWRCIETGKFARPRPVKRFAGLFRRAGTPAFN